MPKKVATQKKGRASGRYQPKKAVAEQEELKRYTPPLPKSAKHSPVWIAVVSVSFIVGGLLIILLNYAAIMPASPSNWYLLGCIAAMFLGFLGLTNYK
jgi:hypothetical protein